MLSRFGALLAFAAAIIAAPAWAAPPSPRAAAEQMQAFGAWMQRIQEAMIPMNEAASRFGAAMSRLPSRASEPGGSPAEVAAIRSSVADVRQAILRTQSQLAQIPPFQQKQVGSNPDVNRLLVEAKGQASRMLAYMDDAEALVAAAERRDDQAVQAAAIKVVRGGFLLLDSQVILYRGRQALFPSSRSAHQLVEVAIQLYRAMSAAGNSWFESQQEGGAEAAALGQRRQFLALADELETALRKGRANLARESVEIAAARPRSSGDPSMARIHAAAVAMVAIEKDQFAIGDELAAWLRARAETPGSVLKAQPGPDFILELAAFEQRLLDNMQKAAAALANPGR